MQLMIYTGQIIFKQQTIYSYLFSIVGIIWLMTVGRKDDKPQVGIQNLKCDKNTEETSLVSDVVLF
jgi:hypothetical protein